MTQPNSTPSLTQVGGPRGVSRGPHPESLADVLERVLDKGVVIVGDVGVSVLDIDLLTLRIRLLIASADTARDMGIDWWSTDPYYSSQASDGETEALRERVSNLERELESRSAGGSASRARRGQ